MSQTPDLLFLVSRDTALKTVADAQAVLGKVKMELAAIEAQASIRCGKCSGCFPVTDQVYIQTHWYTSPHGCTEGDYWNQGEGNWKCPACGFKNRFNNRKDGLSDFYRPEIVALKGKFKRVHECYCDYRGQCDACRKGGVA